MLTRACACSVVAAVACLTPLVASESREAVYIRAIQHTQDPPVRLDLVTRNGLATASYLDDTFWPALLISNRWHATISEIEVAAFVFTHEGERFDSISLVVLSALLPGEGVRLDLSPVASSFRPGQQVFLIVKRWSSSEMDWELSERSRRFFAEAMEEWAKGGPWFHN